MSAGRKLDGFAAAAPSVRIATPMISHRNYLAAALFLALPACSALAGVDDLGSANPTDPATGGAAGAAGTSANGGAAGMVSAGASGKGGAGATAGASGSAGASTGGGSAGVAGLAGQAGMAGAGAAGADGGANQGGQAATGGSAGGGGSAGSGGAAGTILGGSGGAAGATLGGSGGAAGTTLGGSGGAAGTALGGRGGAAGGSTASCGNGVVEVGEECEKGGPLDGVVPCDATTCRLVCSGSSAYRDTPTGVCLFVASTNSGASTLNWSAAKVWCGLLGGRLATFEDGTLRERAAVAFATDELFWVGARQQATTGQPGPDDNWIWDGAPGAPKVGTSSWRAGEPNDAGGAIENQEEDCAVAVGDSDFRLQDRPCADDRAALCLVAPKK